jgi:chorismate mutase
MVTSTASLDDLRRRIDAIDDEMHDLIMRRAELVEAIAGAKKRGQVPVIRPGREALILRRLVERHHGHFPPAVLVRIWREIISGITGMQGAFSVAVCAGDGPPDCWDLARDQYGSQTAMMAVASADDVLHAVAEGRAAVGVLPLPEEGSGERWWRDAARAGEGQPRVMARLPFAGQGNARGGSDALAIHCGVSDPTGDDCTLLVLETRRTLARATLLSALQDAGLSVTLLVAGAPEGDVAWRLVEVVGLVAADDARCGKLRDRLRSDVLSIAQLGSYARPLPAAAVAAPRPGWLA